MGRHMCWRRARVEFQATPGPGARTPCGKDGGPMSSVSARDETTSTPSSSFGEPEHETTREVLAGAAGWVAVDKWVSRGVTLVTFAILGHLLGPRPFGLVALATV